MTRNTMRVRALTFVVVLASFLALAFAYAANDAEAATSCRTVGTTRTINSYEGVLLVRMRMEKSFCWDGYSVTYAPAAAWTAQVTEAGRAKGYSYQGLATSSDQHFAYNNNSQGGHVSRRQAKLVRCTSSSGCYVEPTPTLKIFVYGDGTTYKPN